MSDQPLAALQDRVRKAAAALQPLFICGGGTKTFYGEACTGERLETGAVAGIVAYAPNELVITARAGTLLAEIEQAMAEHRQFLAFEPPRFAAGGTLGGAIATGLSGPRRPYAGAARDFVLGMRVIDGTGEALAFGGRVMKNVAGFDVSRLQTGALGTLGIITEISLKCLPRPAAEATVVQTCTPDESIRRANAWGGKPLPLSATCYSSGKLWVRVSGAESAVSAAIQTIGGERVENASEFWTSVRDHAHPFFAAVGNDDRALWRLSVKSTAPDADLDGEQLIEWGGALRWLITARDARHEPIRAWAKSHGGHATLFRGGKHSAVFTSLDASTAALHKRLKATFDPHGILNRGRLYAEL
ncbi:MAG TPA: glycolate oxidase subunit GlcE [Casimicrobiaceae bacterium]|jgi:glycolate oxidase FAD binding subunit